MSGRRVSGRHVEQPVFPVCSRGEACGCHVCEYMQYVGFCVSVSQRVCTCAPSWVDLCCRQWVCTYCVPGWMDLCVAVSECAPTVRQAEPRCQGSSSESARPTLWHFLLWEDGW